MRNYFILDGVDSRDFGVYISGQGTFNASGRDYNIIPVPGRNGDLVGPEKRFANGTLTYPAFIYSNFKQNIEDFRNFLLSLVGYHDLVDSYHPDQIRKVLFQGPFNADVQTKNDAGRFDIEFVCKPQRFLASGNEVTTFESAGETETFSGSVVTFDNPGDATVSALSTAINPVQDLHGYDSPWPAGGGKNLLDTSTVTFAGITFTQDDDGYVTTNSASDSRTWGYSVAQYKLTLPAGSYKFVWDVKTPSSNGGRGYRVYNDADSILVQGFTTVLDVSGSSSTFTLSGTTNIGVIVKQFDMVARFMVIKSTDSTAWSPFSNICPISGVSAANIVVSPTTTAGDGTTYTVQFGTAGTVYGGTLDVVNGTLTVDRAIMTPPVDSLQSINSHGIANFGFRISPKASNVQSDKANAISNVLRTQTSGISSTTEPGIMLANETGGFVRLRSTDADTVTKANTWISDNGLKMVYILETPQTYTLTPTEVTLLTGTNNVWSDTGDITVTIAFPQGQFTITNPTLFDSQPFLRVYGTGTLGVNSQSVTITQADEYTDIDCEMMDCYKGTTNKNPYVQFTDYNFPVLKPGVNYVSFSGITKVEITPRWWIV